MDKFWVVYGPSVLPRDAPTTKHETKVSASLEALRLSNLNNGKQFFVLEAVLVAQNPPNG